MLPRPCQASTIPGSLSGFIGKSVFVIAFSIHLPASYHVSPSLSRFFNYALGGFLYGRCPNPPGIVFAVETGFNYALGGFLYVGALAHPVRFLRWKPGVFGRCGGCIGSRVWKIFKFISGWSLMMTGS